MENTLKYLFSGNAPAQYPVVPHLGLLWYSKEEAMEMPLEYPLSGEWGSVLTEALPIDGEHPAPQYISSVWLSVVEEEFYFYEDKFSTERFIDAYNLLNENIGTDIFVVIGFAPKGGLSIWIRCDKKSMLLQWSKGNRIDVAMSEFLPVRPDLSKSQFCQLMRRGIQVNNVYCRDVEFIFDNYMKQFAYRYRVAFEKWDGEKWEKYKEDEASSVFDYIEEALYDGTHDKLHDGGLMKYHEAGKPKKLKVQFHVGGDTKEGKKRPLQEYSAYFWFEDERIREVFDRFYGAHPDTKTDFIIKIDVEKNKYQVALYRYGLKEPVVLADDVYQQIVFRNKFECYRSENYNQERGAWIW